MNDGKTYEMNGENEQERESDEMSKHYEERMNRAEVN